MTTPSPPTPASLLLGIGVVVAGVAAGVAGALLDLALVFVQHVAVGYHEGTFAAAMADATPTRRVVAIGGGALVAGLAWWLLRSRETVPSLTTLVDAPVGSRRLGVATIDALVQVVFVGAGGSVGREGAPRQVAAALASRLLGGRRLPVDDLRLLVAAAAGAGLGAVYTTPVAGALFAVEIVLGLWSVRTVLVALAVSGLAVLVARPVTHDATSYPWPGGALTPQTLLWSVAVVPVAIGIGVAFNRLTRVSSTPRPLHVAWRLPLAGLVVGVTAILLPAIPGNGKAIVRDILTGHPTALMLFALALAKPLVTALCLRAGANGGVLTPALATGAAVGAGLALLLGDLGHPQEVAVWALIAGAAVLSVSQRAPLFAIAFSWELARPSPWLLIPLSVACLASWWPVRERETRLTESAAVP